ncbi:hypothetical protein DSAG12_02291 [Promethearchaeum syntrophicum]|uniref:Uncharacterized protein n=1 Tax=Promethearchaeum syntrophicum TaxID=2594042 RepID=A0A5B9DBQ5_9ARCH|nr:hypothetical protein [Candidatus Prometheoarchaeum syntrophicum]QEE16461.1 hypothetical protein DSAG12_02291 [Candidatus Prometheoarchaeum syntrophicum]
MNFEEKYEFAKEKFKTFRNYIEISDFRQFMLLILNIEGDGAEAIMRQLGMGSKTKTLLPYDPFKKAYYTKVISSLSMKNQLKIYIKSEKINESLLNKSDSKIFTENLSEYERKNLLPNKFALITPSVVDTLYENPEKIEKKEIIPVIESLYEDLAEFIASQNLKYIFILEDDTADILFTVNMSYAPDTNSSNLIQFFDVFIDEEKKIRNHTFIRMKKDEIDMEFMNEIKEYSHSDIFKSHFTIIVKIKSFDLL